MFKNVLLLVTAILIFANAVYTATTFCSSNTEIFLQATLEPQDGRIIGYERVLYKNDSALPQNRIYLRLFLNQFRNSETLLSTGLVTGKQLGSLFSGPADWGRIEVKKVVVQGTDMTNALQMENDQSATLPQGSWAFLDLLSPLPPDQDITIEIDFITQLPAGLFGNDFKHQLFVAAFWYPQLCSAVDFQNQKQSPLSIWQNYAGYNVEFVVPKDYTIAASATQIDSAIVDDQLHYRFKDPCLREMAVVTSPNLRIEKRKFQYEDMPPVTIRLIYADALQKDNSAILKALENLLKYYGLWYAPYPKSTFSVVHLPHSTALAPAALPGLGIIGSDSQEGSGQESLISRVILHGGLQYWQQLLSLHFRNAGWIEEGLNLYSQTRLLIAAYGYLPYTKTYLNFQNVTINWKQHSVPVDPRDRLLAELDYIDELSDEGKITFYEENRRRNIIQSALLFWTLENIVGDQPFSIALKDFVRNSLYRRCATEEFITLLTNQHDLDPRFASLFDDILIQGGDSDFKVSHIFSRDLQKRGFWKNGKEWEYRNETTDQVYNRITLEHMGSVHLPVDVVVTMENGETMEWTWDGYHKVKIYEFEHATAVRKVEIDPNHKILIDPDRVNNSLYRKKNIWSALKWTSMWMFWVQHYFEVLASIS